METKKPKPNVFIVPIKVVGEVGLGVDCQCLAARFTRNRFDQAELVFLGTLRGGGRDSLYPGEE